jgi:hypothetical protein
MNTGGVNHVPSAVPSGLAAGVAGLAGRTAREAKTAQEQRRELQGPKRDEVTLGHKAEGESDVDRIDTLDLQSDARGQKQPQGERQDRQNQGREGQHREQAHARDDDGVLGSVTPKAQVPEPVRLGRAGIPMPPTPVPQKHIDLAG